MTHIHSIINRYSNLSSEELVSKILDIRKSLGDNLVILGHHYQNDAIVRLSHLTGDSFKLCRDAANATSRHIVFCGVRFMAESARVLARPEQVVQHPEPSATCPMAEMACLEDVEKAWAILTDLQKGKRIIPVTYMNSNVEIKAFCGRHGGVVCTSSNASRVFDWAYGKGDTILFLPDEHLGRNTANQRGMAREKIAVWDPRRQGSANQLAALAKADLVVWKGFCHVHTDFSVDQIRQIREQHPGIFVIVHPECPEEVVDAADAAGSTEAIIRRVMGSQPNEAIAIGTEINLVSRLADQYPDRLILPLEASFCPNMAKITTEHLLYALENLGTVDVVEVDPAITLDARRALEQMLTLA